MSNAIEQLHQQNGTHPLPIPAHDCRGLASWRYLLILGSQPCPSTHSHLVYLGSTSGLSTHRLTFHITIPEACAVVFSKMIPKMTIREGQSTAPCIPTRLFDVIHYRSGMPSVDARMDDVYREIKHATDGRCPYKRTETDVHSARSEREWDSVCHPPQ